MSIHNRLFTGLHASIVNRYIPLLSALSVREVHARYKGSFLGLFWSILTPVLLLLVYGFVFGVVFQARWPPIDGGQVDYSLLLFCGLVTHLMFSDVLVRSAGLIQANANYVKKVVFPLTIFSGVVTISSAFHFVISFSVVVLYAIYLGVVPSITLFLFPIVLLQFSIFLLGLSWVVSSLGVFFKDVGHVVGFISTAAMFLSPIFYPASQVPESFQLVMKVNPLTYYVESFRAIVIYGEVIELNSFIKASVVSFTMFFIGLIFFRKTKSAFADIV